MTERLRFLRDHPLLFHAGQWQAEGWYIEEHGAVLAAGGFLRVEQNAEHWVVTSELRIALVNQPDMVLQTLYAFETPDEDQREVYWSSPHPVLGSVAGRLTAVADGLLSLGFGEDGRHILNECYLLTEDDTYEVRGALAREGETVGTWAITLEPVADEA